MSRNSAISKRKWARIAQLIEHQRYKIYNVKAHGVRLRKFLEGKDLSFSQVTRRLGHGSRNTLLNWFEREELTSNMWSKLVGVFPDIMSEFPDVEWGSITQTPSKVEEPGAVYDPKDLRDCRSELEVLRKDHIELLARYNKMMEQYVAVLKEKD